MLIFIIVQNIQRRKHSLPECQIWRNQCMETTTLGRDWSFGFLRWCLGWTPQLESMLVIFRWTSDRCQCVMTDGVEVEPWGLERLSVIDELKAKIDMLIVDLMTVILIRSSEPANLQYSYSVSYFSHLEVHSSLWYNASTNPYRHQGECSNFSSPWMAYNYQRRTHSHVLYYVQHFYIF